MTMNEYQLTTAAIARLTADRDDDAALTRALLCATDSIELHLIDSIIDPSDFDATNYDFTRDPHAIRADLELLLTAARTDSYARHALSDLALAESLCPLHLHDYAICFDDELDECATIRNLFPNHDT